MNLAAGCVNNREWERSLPERACPQGEAELLLTTYEFLHFHESNRELCNQPSRFCLVLVSSRSVRLAEIINAEPDFRATFVRFNFSYVGRELTFWHTIMDLWDVLLKNWHIPHTNRQTNLPSWDPVTICPVAKGAEAAPGSCRSTARPRHGRRARFEAIARRQPPRVLPASSPQMRRHRTFGSARSGATYWGSVLPPTSFGAALTGAGLPHYSFCSTMTVAKLGLQCAANRSRIATLWLCQKLVARFRKHLSAPSNFRLSSRHASASFRTGHGGQRMVWFMTEKGWLI